MDFRLRTPDLGPPSLSSFPSFPFVELARPHPRAPVRKNAKPLASKQIKDIQSKKMAGAPCCPTQFNQKMYPSRSLSRIVPACPGMSRFILKGRMNPDTQIIPPTLENHALRPSCGYSTINFRLPTPASSLAQSRLVTLNKYECAPRPQGSPTRQSRPGLHYLA